MTKRSPTARPTAERIPRTPVGPLATAMLNECSTWLTAQGYSTATATGIRNLLARLSLWMHGVNADVDDINEDLLARFVAAENARDIVCRNVKASIATMRRFLTDAGYLKPDNHIQEDCSPIHVVVATWCSWMQSQRGLATKTIQARCYYAIGLLEELAGVNGTIQWDRLTPLVANTYITVRGRPYGAVGRAHIVESVRCLVQWALSSGHLDRDMTPGLLSPPKARRSLPRGISDEQVAALLSVCEDSTVIGARDRALVIILTRLGLRAGEAAGLTLDDLDWANGVVKVTGKGREHTLPIPVDVGEALVAWLKLRPPSLDRSVFVRIRAPRRKMSPAGLSGIIARLSDQAGIERIFAHRLRHTAAINVVAGGGTLAQAQELLGHSHAATTMTYAKVDLASLRELVVPFGQVPR